MTGKYRAGETALIVAVPEAEPVVGGWRSRFDPSAEAGFPAHVTILYPFLGLDRLDEQALEVLFGAHPSFDVRFAECGRFPGVLFLAPVPDQPFRALTEAVVERWPEAPPYRGQFAEIVPHLTVVSGQEPSVMDEVEADLAVRLPVAAHVSAVRLLVHDGDRWHERRSFALRG
jgi:hypothetical protein